MQRILKCLAVGLMLGTSPMAWAQTDTNAEAGASEVDPALLLTQAELENLVAPVALYPDTLLIQILVAATFPFEIIKADRLLASNAGLESEALTAAIEAEGYDMSVEVLATAFPDVLADMAANAEWTESIGTAMLAQSDDVLGAVQTMRDQAINSGALISGPEQTVETVEEEVIITPTDPQVVYVPQYNTETVYVENNNNDALTNALVFFGTVVLINNIFDNNNYWYGYWGCRNCGGWGGRPIIRNPNVDIDINGNVNIGNKVNIGDRNNVGWKPEPRRQQQAQNKIAKKRGPGGATTMPVRKQPSRGDDMRSSLTRKTGAADISRPGADRANVSRPAARPGGDRANVNRPATRPATGKQDAIARTNRKPASAKAPVRQPSARPAAKRQPAARAPAKRQPSAMKQRAAPQKSRAASNRGRASGGARARGRR